MSDKKTVRVIVLKPLHEEGKKTIQPGAIPIDMEESKANILAGEKVKAVEIIKEKGGSHATK